VSNYYILDEDGKTPVRVYDAVECAQWREANPLSGPPNVVGMTKVGDADVSTVFLGLDHNFFGDGSAPILWETMVFGGDMDQNQWRYGSYEDALAGHDRVVAELAASSAVDDGEEGESRS